MLKIQAERQPFVPTGRSSLGKIILRRIIASLMAPVVHPVAVHDYLNLVRCDQDVVRSLGAGQLYDSLVRQSDEACIDVTSTSSLWW
eukprot:COSAG02_NODE_6103_length_3794_cov_3.596752_2_plen_87_part_00